MTQKGTHTWDIIFQYHLCPKCGKIIESREDFHYLLGEYVKDLECPRCHHTFTVTKKKRAVLGPLLG